MTQTPAGWYPDPEMVGTQRYWDGAAWTENRAPAAPAAPDLVATGPSTSKIATGVALGIGGVIGVVWLISSIASSDDGLECAMDNLDRAQQGVPTKVCPD